MSSGSFDIALDEIEALILAGAFEGRALCDAFDVLQKNRPFAMTAAQLERLFCVCYRALALDGRPALEGMDERTTWVLPFQAERLIEETFFDHGARNRGYVASSVRRALGLNRAPFEGAPTEPVPLGHIPLDRAAAYVLAAPYFSHLERLIAEQPYVHLKLCWAVTEYPLAPFDVVFADWLDRLDREGIGAGHNRRALAQAYACYGLATQGQQKLSWGDLRGNVLPLLSDPHPLVVGNAARFLGHLFTDPEDYLFEGGAVVSMAEMLAHLRALPAHRRAAAGGFLAGIDYYDGGPIMELRRHPELVDFDIEDWVFDILALGDGEPYLPGAQAFWFYLHEEYCRAPEFVGRLLDAGHDWIAMMCATEEHEAIAGMGPVLERLTRSSDPEAAGQARRWLGLFYKGADSV